MENFKAASQQKLRFQTNKGLLTTEQLWDLSLEDLDNLAVLLESEHEQSARKSFLIKSTAKEKTTKLRFDIVLDVLNTKVEEMNQDRIRMEAKEHKSKILNLIAEKKDEDLKNRSVEELEAMLK